MFRSHLHPLKQTIFVFWIFWLTPNLFAQTGILEALSREVRLLKNEMTVIQEKSEAGRVFYVGKIKGKDVVIATSSVGKVNGAVTAQLMITLFGIRRMISTGVAGGVDPKLSTGDIVVSDRVIQHDFGVWSSDQFEVRTVPVFEDEDAPFFCSDSELVNRAIDVGHKIQFIPVPGQGHGRQPKLVTGLLATGDQFIASDVKKEWLWETLRARAVDMEGGAVAQVCCQNDVPFLIIRCISDLANARAEVDYDRFVDTAAENSARLVLALLETLE